MKHVRIAFSRGVLGGLLVVELGQLALAADEAARIMWLGLVATTLFMGAMLELAARYWYRMRGAEISFWVVLLTVGFVLIDGAGHVVSAYDRIVWYDMVVHASGGATGVALFITGLRALNARPGTALPAWLMVVTALTLTLAVGVAFEFFEWFIDWKLGIQKWLGDAVDILTDLGASLIGGGVYALVSLWRQRMN